MTSSTTPAPIQNLLINGAWTEDSALEISKSEAIRMKMEELLSSWHNYQVHFVTIFRISNIARPVALSSAREMWFSFFLAMTISVATWCKEKRSRCHNFLIGKQNSHCLRVNRFPERQPFPEFRFCSNDKPVFSSLLVFQAFMKKAALEKILMTDGFSISFTFCCQLPDNKMLAFGQL